MGAPVLGLNFGTHDAAAALVIDGAVVAAAEEERFTRVKQTKVFPSRAIDYCLAEAGIAHADIDQVAFFVDPALQLLLPLANLRYAFPASFGSLASDFAKYRKRREAFSLIRAAGGFRPAATVTPIRHHLAHAASAYLTSPFDRSLVVTLDGRGEYETAAVFEARGGSLTLRHSVKYPHSIGYLYSMATRFLGFRPQRDEYKIMGLAGHGSSALYEVIRDLATFDDASGRLRLNLRYFDHHRRPSEGRTLFSPALERLLGPARQPDEPITDRHRDIAAAVQHLTEDLVTRYVLFSQKLVPSLNLCLAGGVALNGVANAKVIETGSFDSVFVQPAANDAGTSIGAALVVAGQQKERHTMADAFLGPAFGDPEITAALRAAREAGCRITAVPEPAATAARLLADDLVIGWFQGRMEFGPRALGARSVLANPSKASTMARVNALIKCREAFRPLAPAVQVEHAAEFFDLREAGRLVYPFMVATAQVHPAQRHRIAAVVHVDGSARVQTVARADNPVMWEVIEEFRRLTTLPVLLNTSFNGADEPIVCTPEDAVRTFLACKLDALVIGGHLGRRSRRPRWVSVTISEQRAAVAVGRDQAPLVSADHVAERVVTAATDRYEVTVGGTRDSFNSVSYTTTDNAKTMMEVPLFQPDRFLRLANIGRSDVVNPRIVVNGRRSWHSADGLLDEVLRPGMTDREKAFALFRFFSRIDVQAHNNNLRVDEVMPDLDAAPGFNTFRERADPIKAVNSYYPSGCILSAANLVIMARHAGLRARLLAAAPLDGPYDQHGGAEIEYAGAYHYFDPEARTFFLCRDNETVASYEEIHRDPGLVLRTHAHGFAAQECKAAFIMLYRQHFPPYEVPVEQWTHRMDLRLRPGEELVYLWRHGGKYRYGRNSRNRPGVPYRLANGLLIYRPDLADPAYRSGIVHEVNTAMASAGSGSGALHAVVPGHPASVTWKIESPYPIVGGRVIARFVLDTPGRCQISVCTGAAWLTVWDVGGEGVLDAEVDIDEALAALTSPAIYDYYVRVSFLAIGQPTAAGLESVRMESDLQMSQTSLPALWVGRNVVSVRTDSRPASRDQRLKISHGWDESSAPPPPPPPSRAVSPADGDLVEARTLRELVWANEDLGAVADHHVIVSSYPDFLLPVSPNFDRLTFGAAPRWKVSRSFLRPGATYHWKVRSRSEDGAWSGWSPTWTFTVAPEQRDE